MTKMNLLLWLVSILYPNREEKLKVKVEHKVNVNQAKNCIILVKQF